MSESMEAAGDLWQEVYVKGIAAFIANGVSPAEAVREAAKLADAAWLLVKPAEDAEQREAGDGEAAEA